MTWQLTCPRGGKYTCKGHYTGGHGDPFVLHCDDIKTIKGPRGGACLDAELADPPKHRCSGARCASEK